MLLMLGEPNLTFLPQRGWDPKTSAPAPIPSDCRHHQSASISHTVYMSGSRLWSFGGGANTLDHICSLHRAKMTIYSRMRIPPLWGASCRILLLRNISHQSWPLTEPHLPTSQSWLLVLQESRSYPVIFREVLRRIMNWSAIASLSFSHGTWNDFKQRSALCIKT